MKRLSPVFFLILVLLLSACSQGGSLAGNYREIEHMRLIHAVGFDLDGGRLELSVSGGAKNKQGVTRLSGYGQNISDAMVQLQNFSGKEELYYAHTRFMLCGDDYARSGIFPMLRHMQQNPQLRMDIPLFVIRDGRAKDLLLYAGGEENSIYDVLQVVMGDCKKHGSSIPFSCDDLLVQLNEYGSGLVCALDIRKTQESSPDAQPQDLTPMAAGFGILQQGKLVGYLSADSAPGVGILLGKTGSDSSTITLEGQPITYHITKADHRLTPQWGPGGSLTGLQLSVSVTAAVKEGEPQTAGLSGLEHRFTRRIQDWMEDITRQMNATGADFLNFGGELARMAPRRWEAMPVPWPEQLSSLPITVSVDCTLQVGENQQRQ